MKAWLGMLLLVGLIDASVASSAGGDSFSQWKAAQQRAFQDQMTRRQQLFRNMLSEDWTAVTAEPGQVRDPFPKPFSPPVKDGGKKPLAVPLADDMPEVITDPVPLLPQQGKALVFLGHSLLAPEWEWARVSDYDSPKGLVRGYERLTATRYQDTVRWLREQRQGLALGDWGLWKLVQAISESGHSTDGMQATVRQWFLLSELGWDVRLGYRQSKVVLLARTAQPVYGLAYYPVDGLAYYDLADVISAGESLSIHGQVSDSQPVDFAFYRHPVTVPDLQERQLRHGDELLSLEFDRELVRYYQGHPTVDLAFYFAAPLSEHVAQSLRASWARLEGRYTRPLDKLNALMRLVQFGLPYETDQEQFGREYYQLPDELLFHPAADCEDRSIFLVQALRLLLKVNAVGLLYPGHVAVAVDMPGEGDRQTVGRSAWLVADPTYIGALAGQTMPAFAGVIPEVIGAPVAGRWSSITSGGAGG
ncbi:hypothetical protein [Alcanivorax profundi]|nr:hypothetical protein [Alcanivorax profundi]